GLAEGGFDRRGNRLIYAAIVELAGRGKPVDVVTLGEWMEASGVADQVGGMAYLIELGRGLAGAANIEAYAEIVVEKARLRRAIELGTELVNLGFQPEGRSAAEVVAHAQQALAGLRSEEHTSELQSRENLVCRLL